MESLHEYQEREATEARRDERREREQRFGEPSLRQMIDEPDPDIDAVMTVLSALAGMPRPCGDKELR